MIIDAQNLLIGRMATFVAKRALLGENVDVINCEKAVIGGNRAFTLSKYVHRLERGQIRKGPYVYRRADMFVRRCIRGMLPYKQARGKEAFSRIKCYIGFPEELKSQKAITVKGANAEKLPTLKYLYVEEICKRLGGK